jgi:hypothetical protein
MTASIEETVARLRAQETAAQQRRARADAGIAQAEARAGTLREDLRAEFGVSTVDEARAALAVLRQQLETEAADVERLLAQAGGTQ